MRTLPMILALSLVTTALAFIPSAEAVGICSDLKDSDCSDYWLCVGYRSDSRGFECTGVGVRNPFQPCTCPPYEPVLLA